MSTYVKDGEIFRPVKRVYVKDNGAWKYIKESWVKDGGIWRSVYKKPIAAIDVIISSNEDNINLYTKLVAAGWNSVDPVQSVVTINAGVRVGSTSPQYVSLTIPAQFPVGSTIHIVNNGRIIGAGGLYGVNNSLGQRGGGGCAILAASNNCVVQITNNNVISGGGGAGGRGGSTGYPSGGVCAGIQAGGAGGRGAGGSAAGEYQLGQGLGGTVTQTYSVRHEHGYGKSDTEWFVTSTSGAGGAGGWYGYSGSNGAAPTGSTCGVTTAESGGAAGSYIVGNSRVIWVGSGTLYGVSYNT